MENSKKTNLDKLLANIFCPKHFFLKCPDSGEMPGDMERVFANFWRVGGTDVFNITIKSGFRHNQKAPHRYAQDAATCGSKLKNLQS